MAHETRTGLTALAAAARYNQPDAVHALVHLGAGVDVETKLATTALTEAVNAGSGGALRALVHAGANPDYEICGELKVYFVKGVLFSLMVDTENSLPGF